MEPSVSFPLGVAVHLSSSGWPLFSAAFSALVRSLWAVLMSAVVADSSFLDALSRLLKSSGMSLRSLRKGEHGRGQFKNAPHRPTRSAQRRTG